MLAHRLDRPVTILMRQLAFSIAIASGPCAAAPYLVSDPACYSADHTNATCPTEHQYSWDNGATWVQLTSIIVDAQISIHHDLAGLDNGAHEWLVRARNVWGVSASVPFSFTVGAPASPGSVRLEAQ